MEDSVTISMLGRSLVLIMVLTLPVILPAVFVGLLVSIFQALTQIQDNSLSFLPKLIVVFLVLALAGNWMFDRILNFTREIFTHIILR